ncbi:MAG: cytochrome c peroxidase [Acetobacteraceae bacterium]
MRPQWRIRIIVPVAAAALLIVAGGTFAAVHMTSSPAWHRPYWKTLYARPGAIPFPRGNPYTPTEAALGRRLFFDPALSNSGTLACAGCHEPSLGWSDGRARAIGDSGATLALRTPTLIDVAWVPVLGWDGKFRNLESVAFAPITAADNMNLTEAELVRRLSASAEYRAAFARAFPDGAISRRHVEQALATFERTIVAGEAPFDRWIGGDASAISTAAKRGFDLFNGRARCASCHSGWAFTDGSFHDVGSATGTDIGRGLLFPTSVKLRYAFKTPSLRDVARRAPYMHDGSIPTLDAVIALYNRGGIARPSRAEAIGELGLTASDEADLVAFLETLNADRPSPLPRAER